MFCKHWVTSDIFIFCKTVSSDIFISCKKKVSSEVSNFFGILACLQLTTSDWSGQEWVAVERSFPKMQHRIQVKTMKTTPLLCLTSFLFSKTNCQDWVWRTLHWCEWVLRRSCLSLSGLEMKTSNGRIAEKVIHISKALHYMCPEALYTEAFRVLRPGGLLAIAGYHFSRFFLSLFMWINIVDGITFLFWNFFLDPKVQSSKKHSSQYMRYV